MTWRDREAEEEVVLRTLKVWALGGLHLSSKQEHQALPRRPANLPPSDVLDASVPDTWPG